MADWEFERLGLAHAAGVSCPEPLSINSNTDANGYYKETLVLSHMKGFREAGTYDLNHNTPLIVKVKTLREFRKLHLAGLAHGDIHGGNILINDRTKRVALVDFGYSTQLDDVRHPLHYRDGTQNLMSDLRRLPDFVSLDSDDIQKQYKGVYENIEAQTNDYGRSWDRYEVAINRFHDVLERELLFSVSRPRSKFVRSADQIRIPGLTRRILTANANTFQRQVLEQVQGQNTALFMQGARNLGLKPANLFMALRPERQARIAAKKKQPFGNPRDWSEWED